MKTFTFVLIRLASCCAIPVLLSGCIGVYNRASGGAGELDPTTLLGAAAAASAVDVGGGDAGPAGVSLTSSDGLMTVFIPAGAMNSEESFTFTRYTPEAGALPPGYLPTTPVYEISPSYVFAKDVTISITLNDDQIRALNLQKDRTTAFAATTTQPESDAGRLAGNGWEGRTSNIDGDRLVITTRTFSFFGGGSPPPGNSAPVINNAFYYFKPSCQFLPYQVRVQTTDPDGDPLQVYLLIGRSAGPLSAIAMTPEGGAWYRADIPYEAMDPAGIQIKVYVIDSYGQVAERPASGVFLFPTSSGVPAYIANYDTDRDNDGYLDAWEVDNGYNPNNPASPPAGLIPDTDGDGIPDASDPTPNGEAYPAITSLSIFPPAATMDVGEQIAFSVVALNGGAPVLANADFVTTGNASNGLPVGALTGSVFRADYPGAAGVIATVGALNATAPVTVIDTVNPAAINTLTASAQSGSVVRLRWNAVGSDGLSGRASAYEIRRSAAPITDDASCTAGASLAHALTPKNPGLQETVDIAGHSPGQTYYYCVRAYDHRGNRGAWNSAIWTVTPGAPDLVRPAAVSGLSANAINARRIDLSWTAVGDDGLTGAAMYYDIRRSTSAINDNAECDAAGGIINAIPPTAAGAPLAYSLMGLSPETRYYFCIRAYDESNNRGDWLGVVSALTPRGNAAPTVSATTSAVDIGVAATLDASASSDSDAPACAANPAAYTYAWRLIAKPGASARTTADIVNANQLIAQFTPDAPGVYSFVFEFIDDPGGCSDGPRTAIARLDLTATTPAPPDTTPPANIASVQANVLGFDRIRVSWHTVGDDGLSGAASAYEIRYALTPIPDDAACSAAPYAVTPAAALIPANNEVYHVVTGLTQATLYHFCVRAVDDVGQSNLWSGATAVFSTTSTDVAGWGPWGAWSACNRNCGGGATQRTRTCDNPSYGCAGSNIETQSCNTQPCGSYGTSCSSSGSAVGCSCNPGYRVTALNCYGGRSNATAYDYWCSFCACGVIPRGSWTIWANMTGHAGYGGQSSACYFDSAIPAASPSACVYTSAVANNAIAITCTENP